MGTAAFAQGTGDPVPPPHEPGPAGTPEPREEREPSSSDQFSHHSARWQDKAP